MFPSAASRLGTFVFENKEEAGAGVLAGAGVGSQVMPLQPAAPRTEAEFSSGIRFFHLGSRSTALLAGWR